MVNGLELDSGGLEEWEVVGSGFIEVTMLQNFTERRCA